MDAAEQVKRVVALPGGPEADAEAFADAWCRQYAAPQESAARRDEVALAYEAGMLRGLEVRL